MGKRGPERINDARLYLILPASLKARLEQAAAAKGQTVSEYVRKQLRVALGKQERSLWSLLNEYPDGRPLRPGSVALLDLRLRPEDRQETEQ